MTIEPDDLAAINGLTARAVNGLALFDVLNPHDTAAALAALNTAILATRELRALTGRHVPPVPMAIMDGGKPPDITVFSKCPVPFNAERVPEDDAEPPDAPKQA